MGQTTDGCFSAAVLAHARMQPWRECSRATTAAMDSGQPNWSSNEVLRIRVGRNALQNVPLKQTQSLSIPPWVSHEMLCISIRQVPSVQHGDAAEGHGALPLALQSNGAVSEGNGGQAG